MRSSDKLQTLILQVIIHNALIIPRNSYCPLLNFAHKALITFGSDTCDVTIGVRVLSAKFIGISSEYVLKSKINWAIRTTGKERVVWELLGPINFFR